jgi:hypothetical protein
MPIGEIIGGLIGNLGVTFPQWVILITVLGSIIFMAVEVRFGLMMLFLMVGFETVVFWYSQTYITGLGITGGDMILMASVLLGVFVLMTLSLLMVKSKQGYQYGGGIL